MIRIAAAIAVLFACSSASAREIGDQYDSFGVSVSGPHYHHTTQRYYRHIATRHIHTDRVPATVAHSGGGLVTVETVAKRKFQLRLPLL